MELEIKKHRWKYLAEYMQECRRKLLKNRVRLEELLQKMRTMEENEEMYLLRKKISKYKESLEEQERRVSELSLVLEKVEAYYKGCEEQIIEDGEISKKRFTEKVHQVELSSWRVMPVLLRR